MKISVELTLTPLSDHYESIIKDFIKSLRQSEFKIIETPLSTQVYGDFNEVMSFLNKKIYNMNDMKKVTYSAKETDNDISQQSFVGKFLSSIRQKMYGKRKF